MRICIFGDSIIWGAGLPFRVSWSNLLRNYLESETKDYIELYDLGIDGNTTVDLLERFDTEAQARKPDMIVFGVGINDSFYRKTKDNPPVTDEDFRKNIIDLIKRSRRFTERIYFVGLAKGSDDTTRPLARSTTGKCYDKENTEKYNRILKETCRQNHASFIGIRDILTDDDFDDGLHPNTMGHIKIFERIRQEVFKNN